MTKFEVSLSIACVAALAVGIGCTRVETSASPDAVVEETAVVTPKAVTSSDVLLVLNYNCMPCHATGSPKDELALDSLEGLVAGSKHGPVFIEGNAADSMIIKALRGDELEQMPYEKDPLSEEDIKLIEDWINAGAPQS